MKGTITNRELLTRPFPHPHVESHIDWIENHPDVEEVYLVGFDLPIQKQKGRPTIRVTFKDGRDPIEQEGASFSSAGIMFFVKNPEFQPVIMVDPHKDLSDRVTVLEEGIKRFYVAWAPHLPLSWCEHFEERLGDKTPFLGAASRKTKD